MNLHPIRTRRKETYDRGYSRGFVAGHASGSHEQWQAGWNAAQATHPTTGASIGPSYGPDDRIVTSATVGSGGGQTHSGGNGGSDQGVPIGGSASNVQPMADPYEEAKKRRTAYRKSQLDRANGLCTGTTKAGFTCQLPVTPGSNTCHHHRVTTE